MGEGLDYNPVVNPALRQRIEDASVMWATENGDTNVQILNIEEVFSNYSGKAYYVEFSCDEGVGTLDVTPKDDGSGDFLIEET